MRGGALTDASPSVTARAHDNGANWCIERTDGDNEVKRAWLVEGLYRIETGRAQVEPAKSGTWG